MTTVIAILSFAAGIAARHYTPALWSKAKQWLSRKLFPKINQ